MRSIRWPPSSLGLRAPFIAAWWTGKPLSPLRKTVWQSIVAGLVVAGTVILLDSLLFAGASLPRIRSLAEEPFWFRLAIVIYSPLAEELVYRFIIMALLAWVAYVLLFRVYHDALPPALWTGILGAATLFGLAHVGNAPNAPHPFLRAITLNGLAGIVFGWLYWKRGFEAAVLAHFTADALIYLGLANVL
jgi:hypothetical protein